MRNAGKKSDSANKEQKAEKKLSEKLINLNEARLQSLLKISQYPFNNMVEFLDFVLDEAIELTGSKIGYIYYYNEKTREFVLNSWSNEVLNECSITEKQTTYLLDKTGIWGEAVRQRRPIIINDFQAENPLKKGYPSGHSILYKFITIPVINKDVIVAVVGLANKESDYNETDVLQLTLMMDSVWKMADQKKMEKELQISNDKLNIALDTRNIGIWERNLKTDEVIFDERMEKMFDLQPGTFTRTHRAFEDLIHEEDLAHVQRAIHDALEKELPYEVIFRTRFKDGKTKYISSKAVINKEKYGKPISMTGVCFDVTSLKEGTEQLVVKLNEELLRSNKELESFAYVASHDLQEPLRMVTSFTQLLAQQYKDQLDQRAQEYIQFAVEGSKRMYNLLNGLLAYSRIQTKGKAFIQVDLDHILDNVIKNLALKIRERNASVKIEELPIVFADENQMVQLFQNLIFNSIKFSSESPQIHISSKSDIGYHYISVKDKGIGIEPQYFEKIFGIFQRLQPKEEFEGTGVGLAICKRIVERHGGRIWVESNPGKGATFIFTIPKNRM